MKSEGVEPINHISDKFKKARMEAEYKSMYALLCNEAHNSQSVLVSRHLEADGAGLRLLVWKKQAGAQQAMSCSVA